MIVWDSELIAPVGMIADVQFLREHGVSKMVRLPVVDLTKAYPDEDEYLFLIRPQLGVVSGVIEAIRYGGVVSGVIEAIWYGGVVSGVMEAIRYGGVVSGVIEAIRYGGVV